MEQQAEGNSSKDNYLRYNKLEKGKPANFALLEEDPASWWLVWGDPVEGGNSQPFRFISQPCLLYTSPSPRDRTRSRMPSSA